MSDILFNRMKSLCDFQANISWGGNPLDKKDSRKVRDSYILWSTSLIDIAEPSHNPHILFCQLKQWLYKICSIDVLVLESFMKESWVFVNTHDDLSFESLNGYFKGIQQELPFKVGHVIVPLKWWIVDNVTSIDEKISASDRLFLSYFFTFPFKVNLHLNVEEKLIKDYVEIEKELRTIDLPSSLVNCMNTIIKEWFSEFSLTSEEFQAECQHGPGAVADIQRRKEVCNPYKTELLRLHPCVVDLFDFPLHDEGSNLDYSEIVFVPKSMKTYRTISKEPVSVQFFQQGLSRNISNYINKNVRGINLTKQEYSQSLARKGSEMCLYDTLDLSSASDRISYALVDALFTGTVIHSQVIGLRTKYTLLPNGMKVKLAKYAPMGSALCFPIETLVFAAACEYCFRHSGLRMKHIPYRVYGDDIVCHTLLTEHISETLSSLGFVLNHTKSYTGFESHFREACGGEYYAGKDVTPVRLPRNFPGLSIRDHQEVSCIIDLANRCFDARLKYTRRLLLSALGSSKWILPFSRNGKIGIKTDNPSNFHLKKNTHSKKEFHWKTTVRHHSVASSGFSFLGESIDEMRYNDWMLFKYCNLDSECYNPDSIRPDVRKVYTVTPLYLLKEV